MLDDDAERKGSPMALKHAVLAALLTGELSGYQLAKALAQSQEGWIMASVMALAGGWARVISATASLTW